jgi:hypothetical protein
MNRPEIIQRSLKVDLIANNDAFTMSRIFFNEIPQLRNRFVTSFFGFSGSFDFQQVGDPVITLMGGNSKPLLNRYVVADTATNYQGGTPYGCFGNNRQFNLFDVSLGKSYVELCQAGGVFAAGSYIMSFWFYYIDK